MTNPLKYPITSAYGIARTYWVNGIQYRDVHDGIDFAYPQGTPVTLPPSGDWDGVVTYAGLDQYGGAYVDVRAKDGGVGRFLHLSRIDVKVGQHIKGNQQLGLSGGAKGTWGAGLSTGAHLHLGLIVNNRAVDPLPWLQKAYSTVIDPNQLSMSEKKQLQNFYQEKDKLRESPVFSQLFQDEQNAFMSWDGNDNDAPDLQFVANRIVNTRQQLEDYKRKYEELASQPAATKQSSEKKQDIAELVPNNGVNSTISTFALSIGSTLLTLGVLNPEQAAQIADPAFVNGVGVIITGVGIIYNQLRYKK